MGAGNYTIRVHGVLDDSQIRAQLAAIQKEFNTMGFGGKGGKGGAFMVPTGGSGSKPVKGFQAYVKGSKEATKANKKFGASTLDITKKVIQFGATTAVIRGVTSGMGDMVKNVYELDGALTEFKKVSDLSGKGLEKYTDQAYKVGKTVARTGTEMIQAATEFKKSGFSEKDSLELGRVASMYQNVADAELTAGEAANFIVSQMKAYNMTAQQSEHIIDAVNEVSNNFAVSSADIATNIGKASAALATGNVTYEQSIGLMTAMTEITRNGAKSARGLVSIQSRYNQIIDESSSTGKKLTAWYKEHNIAIKDQNGQLRSFYEVGKDVAAIWDTLSDNEKKYYLNTQAGANQSQNLAALMRNYDTAVEATATALDSAGSAAKENARYMESMEGKLKNLKSAWEDFSRKMVNSDMLKAGIDALTDALNFLSTDGGQALIKVAAGFTGLYLAAKPFMALFGLGSSAKAIKGFNVFTKNLNKAGKKFPGHAKKFSGMSSAFVVGSKKSNKSLGTLGKTLAKTFGGGAAGLGLTGAGGLVAGIGLLSVALAKFIPIGEEANKKVFDKKYDKSLEQLEELKHKYKGVKDEIAELEAKRDSGEKLTSGEEHRLELLKEQEEALKRQIELQKERNAADFEKKEMTPDLKNLGGSKLFQETRGGTARTNEQIAAQLGIYDQLTSKVAEFRNATLEAADAQKKFAYGTSEYDDAVAKVSDSMDEVKKKQKEWLDQYGSVDKMPEAMQKSYKAVEQVTDAYDRLSKKAGKGVDFGDLGGKKAEKLVEDFKTLGKNIGISVNEAGKVSKIDFSQFEMGLRSAGFTTEQIRDSLTQITKENPKATVTIDGTDVAAKDVDTVLDYLDKVDGDDPKATVEINGTDVAVSDIKDLDDLIDRINGTDIETTVEEKGADSVLDDFMEVQKGAKVLDALKPLIELLFNGQEAQEGVESTESSLQGINGTTATATVGVTGATEAAGMVGSLISVIASLFGKTVPVMETGAAPSVGRVSALIGIIKSLTGKTVTAMAKTVGAGAVAGLKGMIAGLHSKVVTITTKVKKIFSAKGTRHAPEGLAEVNENGFEYIRDAKTGELRVAGGGKRTTTILGEGDTVYTHGQSLRMKQEAKEPLPQFKKGKKGKVKSVSKKAYNKAIKKIRDKYEKELEKLEYQRDVKHWTDDKFAKEKEKLYKKYEKKVSNYNKTHKIKAKKKKDRKKKTGLGGENKRDLGRTLAEVAHDNAVADIESAIDDYLGTAENLQTALAKIEAAKKAQKISAEEALDLQKQAYKANVDYNMKLLEQGKITYKELEEIVKKYYEAGMLTEKEYYEYLEDAAEEYKNQIIDKMEKIIDEFYDTVDKSGKIIGGSFEDALAQLRDLAAEGNLTVEEALELERQLYAKHLSSMFNAYQYDKKTYADMKNMIHDYYNAGKLAAEDYYDYLQQLADEQMSKEKDRIEELQRANNDQYDLAKLYVQQQIDLLEQQNDELDEQNELIELQNDLEKAKARRVRVYREGVGFVYEQDREAIEEAQKALIDYQKEQDSPELKAWKDVLELFDQQEVLANIKELEVRLGSTVGTLFGAYGTSTTAWTEFIKRSLTTDKGYEALLEDMDKVTYWDDVLGYLNGSGQIDASTLVDYFNRYQYNSNVTKGATSLPSALNNTGSLMRTQVMPTTHLGSLDTSVSGLDVVHMTSDNDSYVYNFDSLVLPNVTDANSLVNELRNLPNKALQFSGSRA